MIELQQQRRPWLRALENWKGRFVWNYSAYFYFVTSGDLDISLNAGQLYQTMRDVDIGLNMDGEYIMVRDKNGISGMAPRRYFSAILDTVIVPTIYVHEASPEETLPEFEANIGFKLN